MADPDVDVYGLTHNETSTGVSMPLVRPEGASAEDGCGPVDATSAAGGLRFDPAQIDVYYFAPQKCLASDGGLWLAAVLARRHRAHRADRGLRPLDSRRRSTSQIALDNSRKDQTYNTPALATVFLAVHQVEWINENGGLHWAASRCDRSAQTPSTTGPRADRAPPRS